MDQPGFFDIYERLARLSGLGDQLEAFSRAVDFDLFRPELEKTLSYSDGSKGGRPKAATRLARAPPERPAATV